MASAVKYDCLTRDLCNKVHDCFGADTGAGTDMDELYVALTNTAPNVAIHEILAHITEIANGNGYTTGGADLQATASATGGVVTVVAQDVVWTASGSPMATFRYPVVYNNTPTSPADPLWWYYDYGSSITPGVGETFTFDAAATFLTVT